MVRHSSPPKPCIRNSPSSHAEGFTLIELLIVALIGMIVLGVALSITQSSRNIYDLDSARTRANQNLTVGLDMIAADIRQAGERLEDTFPVLEVTKSANGTSDVLVLRRNLIADVFHVCAYRPAGIDVTHPASGPPSPNTNCGNTVDKQALLEWRNSRTRASGTNRAFLYHPTRRAGEFIDITNEDFGPACPNPNGNCPNQLNGARLRSTFASSPRTTQYPPNAGPRVYLVEERRYHVDENNTLILTENGVERPIAPNITRLQVSAYVNTDSTMQTISPGLANSTGSFNPTNDWKTLVYLDVTLTGRETFSGAKVMTRTLNSRVYPRNTQSH